MPKKDIQGGHPGGFEPLTSEPPSLNGLVAHPLNPHKIQSQNPKIPNPNFLVLDFGFWNLQFCLVLVLQKKRTTGHTDPVGGFFVLACSVGASSKPGKEIRFLKLSRGRQILCIYLCSKIDVHFKNTANQLNGGSKEELRTVVGDTTGLL